MRYHRHTVIKRVAGHQCQFQDTFSKYHLPNCLRKARTMSEIAYIPALPREIHQKRSDVVIYFYYTLYLSIQRLNSFQNFTFDT